MEHGTITENISDIAYNSDRNIDYSPEENYVLDSITVDGTPIDISTAPEAYGFKNITRDHEIAVVYKLPYKATNHGVYSDGQYVWIGKCDRLHPGEVGLFLLNGDGYIKVYEEREPTEPERERYMDSYGIVHPQIVLVSYNSEKYDPIRIMPEYDIRFSIVGRVLN